MKLITGSYSGGPFAGWIEDAAKTWIVFVRRDGGHVYFGERTATGACVG